MVTGCLKSRKAVGSPWEHPPGHVEESHRREVHNGSGIRTVKFDFDQDILVRPLSASRSELQWCLFWISRTDKRLLARAH